VSGPNNEAEQQILEVIREQLNIDVSDAETDLIDAGLLDSLAVVMLITALEEAYACVLPLDDFDLGNFRTARRMSAFLASCGVLEARDNV
jgi:D-alanine--poly(phosphoribitol) ligase subunit 2